MASNLQHEPTMEEILASIRKIISEDSSETEAKHAPANAEDGFDVLELRREDVLDEQPEAHEEVGAPAEEHEPAGQAEEHAQEHEPVMAETAVMSAEEPVGSQARPRAKAADLVGEEGFFSESARKAMDDAFAKLDSLDEEAAPTEAPLKSTIPPGASVQDVFEHAIRGAFGPAAGSYLRDHADEIVERMKPIIREWMDEHFPAILEGAVRNEVERAVRASAQKSPRR